MLKQLKKLNNFEPFFEELVSTLSMEKLEEVFGIVIKKQKSDSDIETFNLYKNGELIFAEMESYEISAIVEQLGYRITNMLHREATEDTNMEEISKRLAEQECERHQYYICSECGTRQRYGSYHYHRVGDD